MSHHFSPNPETPFYTSHVTGRNVPLPAMPPPPPPVPPKPYPPRRPARRTPPPIPPKPQKDAASAALPSPTARRRTLLPYLVDAHASLALATHFLSGFRRANWTQLPSAVTPSCGTANTRTSQLDADIAVARHLSLSSTLSTLVRLDGFPHAHLHDVDVDVGVCSPPRFPAHDEEEAKGMQEEVRLWRELVEMEGEAREITQYLGTHHGVRGVKRQREEMRELRALGEWYAEVLSPVLEALIVLLGGRQQAGEKEKERVRKGSGGVAEKTLELLSGERARPCAEGVKTRGTDARYHPRSFRARIEGVCGGLMCGDKDRDGEQDGGGPGGC